MNYISKVSSYAHQNKLKIHENYKIDYFTSNGIFQNYSIKIGSKEINIQKDQNIIKKDVRFYAYKEFYEKYEYLFIKPKIPKVYNTTKPGIDYLKYSRDSILTETTIHINNIEFFNMSFNLVSFDSEGSNPPCLVQFCFEPTNVYLFYLPQFKYQVSNILQNPNITKIVCDVKSEEKSFKTNIINYIDIQGKERKSLVTCIKDKYNIELKKNKRIHFKGWKQPFTQDQIDYAAADAIWTLLVK